MVAVITRRTTNEAVFFRVRVSRNTLGWMQREAVAAPSVAGDDRRLMNLIQLSTDFDRLARARIFLDFFPRSDLRAEVLRLFAETAEAAAVKLSREAKRKLNHEQITAREVHERSYFLNYIGLDRYNRQGIRFVFDSYKREFRYNGAAWKEILRRYPASSAATVALERLKGLQAK
jgi:hypothetical protein